MREFKLTNSFNKMEGRHFSDEERDQLIREIENLSDTAHSYIGFILRKHKIKYSANNSNVMVYFGRKHIPDEVIMEIYDFVERCKTEKINLQKNIYDDMRTRVGRFCEK